MRFNSDSGANYSGTQLDASGSAVSTGRLTRSSGSPFSNGIYIGQAVNARNTRIINIMNYSNSTTLKTVLIRPSLSTFVSVYVGLWNSTAAITSITLTTANSFSTGSTFTLYGIAAA
jgi:hypothetical protein